MAFPVVAASAAGPNNSTTPTASSFSATLPSGIVSGSLVVVAVTRYSSADDISFPAGWTEFGGSDIAGPTNSIRMAFAYRFCNGSEGASITISLAGAASGYAWSTFRLIDHHPSTPPELLGTATGTSANPNSGSGDPTGWETVDTLWMAFAGWTGVSNNRTGLPSGYTSISDAATDNAGGHPNRHASAWKKSAAASEDAGQWAITTSAPWIATMVAVAPTTAIAYNSVGGFSATAINADPLVPTCPANVDPGDLLIAHVCYRTTVVTPTTPSGWTLLDSEFSGNLTGEHFIYGKIADGTEDGATLNFGTGGTTNARHARVYRFINVRSDTITNVVGGHSASGDVNSTTVDDATVTTPENGCLAVNLIYITDDLVVSPFTGETGGDWVEATAEATTAVGSDGAQGIQIAEMSSAGTISGGSYSQTTAGWSVMGFYIRPVSTAQSITDGGAIASAEVFGTGALSFIQFLTAGGAIASAEAFGTGLVGIRQDLSAGGNIVSAEVFGVGLVRQGLVNGGAIPSAEAFGAGTIISGNLTNGGAIPSAQVFGVGALSFIQLLTGGGGIPSGQAFGTGLISIGQDLTNGGGIASGETFGVGAVTLLGILTNGGALASAETFGVGSLGFGLIGGGHIPSSEVFGIGSLQYNQIINGGAIVSGEAFGFGLIQKKTDLTVYYQTADTKYSAALAFPKPTGTVPLNAAPDDGNTTELVIRMLLTAYRAPSRNPTVNTITSIPLIDESSNVAYGGITLSQGVQGFAKVVVEGHIDTPSTEISKFSQPDLIIDGFKMTYGEFIVSAIEGRVAALNGVWRRTGPTWFRDPYGRVFNNPTVIDFTGNYVEGVPGRINFNATFALPNPVHT